MTLETSAGAPPAAQDERLAAEVAWACRILAMLGYEDLTLGHVSARASDDRTILIKRKGVALGEVTPADVWTVDLAADDPILAGTGMHLETVLHTEVYKLRPEVRSVIHGHPLHATAFGATDASFQYLTHDSVLFSDGVSVYDGVPDLIVNREQGEQVARALGSSRVLLMRNHGVLIAERDVRWAVLAGALLERAIQLQVLATTLGPLHPIEPSLLDRIHAMKYQDGFATEYWDAWVRELRRSGRAFGMPGEP